MAPVCWLAERPRSGLRIRTSLVSRPESRPCRPMRVPLFLEPPRLFPSTYKPENGPTFKSVAGRHFNDYLSLQATYGWNRNTLRLTSSESSGDRNAFYEQTRSATQHTALAEFLVYVRKKSKTVRPYLSVGVGAIHFNSGVSTIRSLIEEGVAAPGAISSTGLAVRSAVGIDVFIKGGWAFRFSFDETIRNNPISAQLNPPGERKLAHFQNLVGFVKTF